MKHYKEIDIPAKKGKVLTKTTCDLCGFTINDNHYQVDDVEIIHRTGVQYPEGGGGKEINIDMCGQCFDEKLIPWLKEQGCDPKSKDWEW